MVAQQQDPVECPECGQSIQRCDECLHAHDWYDHVLIDHMCRWCVMSDYEQDPFGPPPHVAQPRVQDD